MTNEVLRDGLAGPKPVTVPAPSLVVPLFAAYIDYRIGQGYKKGTLGTLRTTLARLKRYEEQTGRVLRVDGYTDEVHQQLLDFELDEGLEPSSIGNTCKHLITFFKYCRKPLNLTLHPDHAGINREGSGSEPLFLTEADLLKLETAGLPPGLDRVRDSFLFQCYTGLRYTDLWRLEQRHIEQRDGYSVLNLLLEKSVSRQSPGGVNRLEVPLLDGALRVLERYRASGSIRLLPVLTNQKMNGYLKEVARLSGLVEMTKKVAFTRGVPGLVSVAKWERVTTHVARHTYATLSLMKGVPLEVVSKALGHSDIKTTMIYAKVVNEWKNQTILNAWK